MAEQREKSKEKKAPDGMHSTSVGAALIVKIGFRGFLITIIA